MLTSRPELSARLAAARVQGLGKQLAECREALQQKSAELSAAAHEVAQLRKESAQLQQHAASLKAQVLGAMNGTNDLAMWRSRAIHSRQGSAALGCIQTLMVL